MAKLLSERDVVWISMFDLVHNPASLIGLSEQYQVGYKRNLS
jgi:hypothetical protein